MNANIYIVGLGPGNGENMTPLAMEAIERSQVIVGYGVYVDLIRHLLADKKVITSPMKKEIDRCQAAVDEALAGQTVAVVCSGDAGIYGLAGLVCELAEAHPQLKIEVVAGITAAVSSAAILGAPLVHDFALISLSDLLTPWEKIEARLVLASEADFVICLYNPRSRKRHDHLARACDLMLKHKSPGTQCGYVKNSGREGQAVKICTLGELRDHHEEVDMFTTLIIGNSQTKVINGRLVTPRGYHLDNGSNE